MKIDKEMDDFQDLLKQSRALVLRFIQLLEPSAACFGHNDEDYEEEAHSPDSCYRQHHRCQNAWKEGKEIRKTHTGIFKLEEAGNIFPMKIMAG